MNQWAFVIAAYAVTATATLGLVVWALSTMRRAEADAEAVKRQR